MIAAQRNLHMKNVTIPVRFSNESYKVSTNQEEQKEYANTHANKFYRKNSPLLTKQ